MTQIEDLQRQVRTLQRGFALMMAAFLAVSLFLVVVQTQPVEAKAAMENISVKRIAVVDDKGTERVVIAAPVPDPLIDGKRVKRQGAASGIIIYDANGVERGGYLTSDEKSNGAMLTLDGIHAQVFTAYANADNGATLSLNNQKGDGVTLTTWNQPVIQMKQDKKIILHEPADAPVLH